ncbi:MAG TPA: hypothetical protein DEH25_02765 [Chloroflexi bacterium]|nr:hypothetical protein [Chloroflexota bacterium]HBY07368.1 hypothetical protein [Chloroflexota bacterium]
MSNIVAFAFEGEETAEGMLGNVLKLEEQGKIEVLDAVVASRGIGKNVDIKQTQSAKGKFTKRGAGVGFLAGLLLGGPILGAVGGAAVGAISGSMKDVGIKDDFIEQIAAGLGPNSSAIFLMTQNADMEAVEKTLKPLQARVLTTTLDPEVEAKIKKLLAEEKYN